jgi:hypothetical protein
MLADAPDYLPDHRIARRHLRAPLADRLSLTAAIPSITKENEEIARPVQPTTGTAAGLGSAGWRRPASRR